MSGPSVSVVIPTFNERENVGPLIRAVGEVLAGREHEILVVDDGSPDGTGLEVERLSRDIPGLRLIAKPRREGIGAALRYGYDRARKDVILSMDADLSFDPADIPRLLAALEAGADLALGCRHGSGGGYERPNLAIEAKYWVSRVGNAVVRRLTGLGLRDYSANFRAVRREVWRAVETQENSNALLLEMILKVSRSGFKVTEIPVKFSDRRRGQSKLNLWVEVPKFLARLARVRPLASSGYTPPPRPPSVMELAVVAAVVLAAGLFVWAEPWHMDEPFYLAIARQILRDPLRPLDFSFNWYGQGLPMARLHNNPPLLCYALAGALKISGGGEWATRALFFPVQLASAWALLALACRYLKSPLWPVLILLCGPAWPLNMGHAMAEGLTAGFAMPALWLLTLGVEENRPRAFWASAALSGLAILSKYNAVFLVPAAAGYCLLRGVSWMRTTAWTAAALSGVLGYQAWDFLAGGSALGAVWSLTSQSTAVPWAGPGHKARALLSFTGGLGVLTAAGGFFLRPGRGALLLSAAGCAALFSPWMDIAPLVRPVDRLTGFLLAWGACLSAWALIRGWRSSVPSPLPYGSALWLSWAASAAALQAAYWSVLARFIVFLLPPLVFGLWERLEAERPKALPALGRVCLAAAAALGAAIFAVDLEYAVAQRRLASHVASDIQRGRRVWFAGHWGLQEYLCAAGARALDRSLGGWDAARPGDLVVVPKVNSNILPPSRRIPAQVSRVLVESPIPLRHMSGWSGEGGYYSSAMGFLPWSLSREPVEEFTLVEVR